MAIGFLLVGPAPFITTLIPTTGLIQGSAAIIGTGYAMIIVSTFGRSTCLFQVSKLLVRGFSSLKKDNSYL